MPRMLPSKPDPDSPNSEKRVFKALEQSLPDDWVCIHSRRFVLPATENRSVKEGEIDFIVLHPSRGYVCLEVKGGIVERDQNNAWSSTDGSGEKHKIKDPGSQAQNACRSIGNYLHGRIQGPRLHYSWGVIFPDITVKGDLGPALPRGIISDCNDLENIDQQLETLLDTYGAPTKEIPKGVKEAFVAALAPTFSLVPLLRDRINKEAGQLVRLTDEQKNALDYCRGNKRVVVEGGAGTGKTILAMEKARRLAEEGKRVRFICYNKPLADSLNEEAEGFVASTFHELCREMAAEADLEWKVPEDKKENQAFWDIGASDLLTKAMEKGPEKRYDAVIVDEGQDFKLNWWGVIEKLMLDQDSSHLYVFLDQHQDIYDGELSGVLKLSHINLSFNCRNTIKIAEYCSGLIDEKPVSHPDAPPGRTVKQEKVETDDQMVSAVRKMLHYYVNEEGIPPEKIVILTGRSLKDSPVRKADKLGNHELVELQDESQSNSVLISTLHRFKGLESDIVIVCDFDRRSEKVGDKHLYVAASRAKHELAVIEYKAGEEAASAPSGESAVA